MGFKDAREMVIAALREGRVRHDERSDIDRKNLLHSGTVTEGFVIGLLLRCAGWEYSTSRHHSLDADCHIFTPMAGGERWYIKVYLEPDRAVFISVHP